MDEVARLMDWDLEAVVRGSSSTIIHDPHHHPYFSHNLFSEQDGYLLGSFPEFSETTNVFIDEFEDLYKPFYPVFHPLSSQTAIVTSSLLSTIPQEPKEEVKDFKDSEKVASQDLQTPSVALASKYKRSKKKQKSVVKKVTEVDGSFSDEWAWRKYGQKPIKSSPYPRSYYRCSSSKGCLARKQVEKSHIDPRVFLITYTSEHNHPQPTRKNSLAGSTRKNNKSSVTPRTPSVAASSNNIEDDELVIGVQQSKGMMEKEEELLLDWLDLDEVDDAWIPSKELEEFIGLEDQQLVDGCT